MATRSEIGQMLNRVLIRRLSTLPVSTSGLQQQFDAGIERWADKQHISSGAYYAAAQTGEQVTHWFVVRRGTLTRPEDLSTDLVIEHAGRRYRIVRAREHPKDRQYTAIEALDLGEVS